jgi:hypothetical protein
MVRIETNDLYGLMVERHRQGATVITSKRTCAGFE